MIGSIVKVIVDRPLGTYHPNHIEKKELVRSINRLKRSPMRMAMIFIGILVLVALLGLWAFLSLGRAGGEIGFKAEVIRIEDGMAYATVTEDDAGFLSRKLPETIVIYAEDFPEYDIQVGDQISGIYIRKRSEGNFYRVVSILVNGT